MAKRNPALALGLVVGGYFLIKKGAEKAVDSAFQARRREVIEEQDGKFTITVSEPLPQYADSTAPQWVVAIEPAHGGRGAVASGEAGTVEQAYADALAWVQANR